MDEITEAARIEILNCIKERMHGHLADVDVVYMSVVFDVLLLRRDRLSMIEVVLLQYRHFKVIADCLALRCGISYR